MKKLLIIEDDQIVANIYRNKFVSQGYHVELAFAGEEGLKILQRFTPDAVLLDLMLPQMSGLEIIKNIRSQSSLHHLPIVVFSNTYLTNMVQDAWKAGATKCLSKANCSPKQVIEAVESTLVKGIAKTPTASTVEPVPVVGQAPVTAAPRATDVAPDRRQNPLDAEFQCTLQKQLLENLPGMVAMLRNLLKNLLKAGDEPSKVAAAQELYRRIHALTSNAGLTGMTQIARLCEAVEALLKELQEKPKSINGSTLRTLASGIDVLALLCHNPTLPGTDLVTDIKVLVVDDEPISRRAISSALDKVRLKSTSVEDPAAAYEQLQNTNYDLVFLDIDMPGMNGYELCAKLRETPNHKQTPVVFVTALNDLETRANSLMSGGNDFIAKPFLFVELAVKALVYVFRSKIYQN